MNNPYPFSNYPPELQEQLQSLIPQDIPAQLRAPLEDLLSQTISLTISTVDTSLIPTLSTCAAFGYFIGDWTSSLADEAALLRQMFRGKSKPAHYFYFLARVFGFFFILLLLLFTTQGRKSRDAFNCSAVPKVYWAFNIIALGSAYALLALRCSALLGRKPIFTYSIYAAATLTTLTYVTGFVGIRGDQTFTGFIACTLYPIKKYVAISYLVSFFYDSAITFLSVMGLVYSSGVRQATLKGPNSSRLRKIILGNALYFLVLILISLSSGILPLINLDPGIIAVLSGPHTAATCCMSLKIFRQLRSSIVNPKATLDRTPGSSGSSEPSKQGFSSPPQAPTSFSRSREASFSSKREVPIYRISRPEEINLRPLGYETDDLEKLTTYDR